MTQDCQRLVKSPSVMSSPGAYADLALAGLAAFLYNVWPLGFWLDPSALHGTYVSVLEVPGHPYAHLFMACDLATGVTALVAGFLLCRRHALAGLGFMVFGVGTIAEGMIPIAPDCATSVASCGIDLGQVIAPHDIASIASALSLALSVLAVRNFTRWMPFVTTLWIASGLFLVSSIVVERFTMASQAAFLIACGIALIGVPIAVRNDQSRLE